MPTVRMGQERADITSYRARALETEPPEPLRYRVISLWGSSFWSQSSWRARDQNRLSFSSPVHSSSRRASISSKMVYASYPLLVSRMIRGVSIICAISVSLSNSVSGRPAPFASSAYHEPPALSLLRCLPLLPGCFHVPMVPVPHQRAQRSTCFLCLLPLLYHGSPVKSTFVPGRPSNMTTARKKDRGTTPRSWNPVPCVPVQPPASQNHRPALSVPPERPSRFSPAFW